MNIITLSGRITQKIELNKTKNDKEYVKNTIAVRRDKDTTDFIDFVVWNQQAKFLSSYGNVGDKIVVSGALQTSVYEKGEKKHKNYVVAVNTLDLLNTKQKETEQPTQEQPTYDVTDDDLPF